MKNSEIDWKEVPILNDSNEETNSDIPEKSTSQSLSKKVSFSKEIKINDEHPQETLEIKINNENPQETLQHIAKLSVQIPKTLHGFRRPKKDEEGRMFDIKLCTVLVQRIQGRCQLHESHKQVLDPCSTLERRRSGGEHG